MDCVIKIIFDPEANVWVASNEHLPLVLEDDRLDRLIEQVKSAVPEIVELNGIIPPPEYIFTMEQCTVQDVAHMENHAEMIDGKVVVTDQTTVTHQRAVSIIRRALESFIEKRKGQCEVFTETVALFCNELCDSSNNLFLPDVMVVCNQTGIKEDGIHTVPKFVAEVTSPSTKRRDFTEKLTVYAKIGVEEYWVVDLQKNTVVRYLSDNDFMPEIMQLSASIPVHTYTGLKIDFSPILK